MFHILIEKGQETDVSVRETTSTVSLPRSRGRDLEEAEFLRHHRGQSASPRLVALRERSRGLSLSSSLARKDGVGSDARNSTEHIGRLVRSHSFPEMKIDENDGKDEEIPEKDDCFEVSFSCGIPSVEITYGVLRLFRDASDQANVDWHPSISDLPYRRSDILCFFGVPNHVSGSELCKFLEPFESSIQFLRIVRRRAKSSSWYMVIVKCTSQEVADTFYLSLNGKTYNSLEPERVVLLFIDNMRFGTPLTTTRDNDDDDEDVDVEKGSYIDDGRDDDNGDDDGDDLMEENVVDSTREEDSGSCGGNRTIFPHGPLDGVVELPTCPVCLERLDSAVSGVLTILCNHSFHTRCLARWKDSSCPVCRSLQQPTAEQQVCSVCGTQESLWMCLICGFTGCGRYASKHARQHFLETSHSYSVELETQRVWDYVGDGYVHRLVEEKGEQDFVEVEGIRREPSDGCKCEPSKSQKEERIFSEYNYLLTSQLETQRVYYEEKMVVVTEELKKELTSLRGVHLKEKEQSRKRLKDLEKEKRALKSKLEKRDKEVDVLRELNSQLVANQKDYQERIEKEKDRSARLEEEVGDLMMHLTASQRVQQNEEMAEGSIQLQPNAKRRVRKR